MTKMKMMISLMLKSSISWCLSIAFLSFERQHSFPFLFDTMAYIVRDNAVTRLLSRHCFYQRRKECNVRWYSKWKFLFVTSTDNKLKYWGQRRRHPTCRPNSHNLSIMCNTANCSIPLSIKELFWLKKCEQNYYYYYYYCRKVLMHSRSWWMISIQ